MQSHLRRSVAATPQKGIDKENRYMIDNHNSLIFQSTACKLRRPS
jgi:hypothetical protein